jgi:hypothetical protein
LNWPRWLAWLEPLLMGGGAAICTAGKLAVCWHWPMRSGAGAVEAARWQFVQVTNILTIPATRLVASLLACLGNLFSRLALNRAFGQR